SDRSRQIAPLACARRPPDRGCRNREEDTLFIRAVYPPARPTIDGADREPGGPLEPLDAFARPSPDTGDEISTIHSRARKRSRARARAPAPFGRRRAPGRVTGSGPQALGSPDRLRPDRRERQSGADRTDVRGAAHAPPDRIHGVRADRPGPVRP